MADRKQLTRRFMVIYVLFVGAFFGAIVKIGYIQTVEHDGWMSLAKRYEMSERDIRPMRGNVFASDGKLIASTIPYFMVYMDTKTEPLHAKRGELFRKNVDSLSYCLARYVGEYNESEYRRRLNSAYARGDRNFKVIGRKISYTELQRIKTFPLFREGTFRNGLDPKEIVNYRNGLKLRQLENRENLFGDLASRTVGNVYGAGMGGRFGLELGYDSLLRGKMGREQRVRVGSNWVYIPVKEPKDGLDLVTTLDMRLQDIADKALRDKLIQLDANMGCLVLMEVHTGDIKACVNLSRVAPGEYREQYNMAFGDMSEPGSTFKTLSLLVGLEDGAFKPSDSINTFDGKFQFYDKMMTDHNMNRGGYGMITVKDALAFSSNVGVSRVINNYYANDPAKFVDGLHRIKITEKMDLGIKGAGVPDIMYPDDKRQLWSKITLPWMSIGYAVKMPPIYTLTFYNAIANNGKMIQPRLVTALSSQGMVVEKFPTKVINPKIASSKTLDELKDMLQGVVSYGTGSAAKSKVVTIAGKTGTAQLGYGKGIDKSSVTHQVSFCGYFPVERPMYSAIVVIRQPRIGYASGNSMSGAVFRTMAERVYAQVKQVNINDMNSSETVSIPSIASGNRRALRTVLDYLDLDYKFEKAEWLTVKRSEGEIEGDRVEVRENCVPNVMGMCAQDAVYLMEKSGLYVQLYGKGKVRHQSLQSGTKVPVGGTVLLTLN